jgi:murein tripeptide amidase MpaA
MALLPHGTRSPVVLTLALVIGMAVTAGPVLAQDGYHDAAALRSAFDRLARAHGGLVEISDLTRSPGGRPVFAVRLGRGDDVNERPALLVIANAEGTHVAGSELALAIASRLAGGAATDTAIRRLLDRTTLYIIPRANPDAAEAMFGRPLTERTRNGTAMDDDHDQAADEDGPEDLNGDGLSR